MADIARHPPSPKRSRTRPQAQEGSEDLHPDRLARFEVARDARAEGAQGVRIDRLSEAEQRKRLFGG